jgi:hypothetical protein
VGSLSVLATVALNCGVLVVGGETLIEVAGRVVPVNWTLPVAALMLLIHLPLAIVEGLVLGFTINLLARVRPDLLRGAAVRPAAAEGTGAATPAALEPQYSSPAGSTALGSPALLDAKRLIAILAVLLTVTPSARAHRLDADYKVLSGQVRIEGWFDIGDEPPAGAVVQVTHENGMTVVEGKLDEKGTFTFKFRRAENLRIVISAGAGHRKELRISAAELARSVDSNHSMPAKVQTGAATSERRRSLLDLLMRTALGIGIIASAATFALAWLRRAGSPAMAPEASPHPVALPTAPNLH